MDPRDPAVPELLLRGRIDVTGRLVDASNATLFGTISADGVEVQCVYKPVRGERPLWDFPDGTLGEPADAYLAKVVPEILASPAYKKDGLLVITFGSLNPAAAAAEPQPETDPLKVGSLLISRCYTTCSIDWRSSLRASTSTLRRHGSV